MPYSEDDAEEILELQRELREIEDRNPVSAIPRGEDVPVMGEGERRDFDRRQEIRHRPAQLDRPLKD